MEHLKIYEQFDTRENMRKNLEEALIHFLSLYYNLVRKSSEGSITIGTAGNRRVEIGGFNSDPLSIKFYGFTYLDYSIEFLRRYYYKSAEVKIHNKYSLDKESNTVLINTRLRDVEKLTNDLSMFQDTNVDYYLDQKKFGI